jgi:hypoxanthine phosphoribosyltransferase
MGEEQPREEKPLKVGAGWAKGNAIGILLNGENENITMLMLPNKKKRRENSPDWHIFKWVPKEVDTRIYNYCFNYKPIKMEEQPWKTKKQNNQNK